MEPIRVCVCEPGNAPELRQIGTDLESWRKIVGGDIEGWGVGCAVEWLSRVTLICNGDGIARKLPANVWMQRLGTVCGTFFLTAGDGEGESVSLTDEEARLCLEYCYAGRGALALVLGPWPVHEVAR